MTKVEGKIFDFVKKQLPLIMLITVTVLGLFIRWKGMDFQSDDFRDFLSAWWNRIEQGGIESLSYQVGNYNIPYQIIIYILTLLPFQAMTAYKLLSIFFDIARRIPLFVSEAVMRFMHGK